MLIIFITSDLMAKGSIPGRVIGILLVLSQSIYAMILCNSHNSFMPKLPTVQQDSKVISIKIDKIRKWLYFTDLT